MTDPLDAVPWPLFTERLVIRRYKPEDADRAWHYRQLPEVVDGITAAPATLEAFREYATAPHRMSATLVIELRADERGAGELRASELRANELRASELRANELRTSELRANELKAGERDASAANASDSATASPLIGDIMLRVEDGWAQSEVSEQARGTQAELGWVLDPAYGGRGYATEAVRAVIGLCFGPLGLRRVHAGCFAENESSWRLMERVGMRREEFSRESALHRSGRWVDGMNYGLLASEWDAVNARPLSS